MKAPGYRSNPKAYDLLKIGGLQVPGEWNCEAFGRGLKFKHPKGSGDDGGTPYPTGLKEDQDIVITTQLHDDEEEAEWEVWCATNFPVNNQTKRGRKPIENVQAARHGIREVLVHNVSESRPFAGAPIVGKITCRVSGTKSGKSKKASLASKKPPTPFDPHDLYPLNVYSRANLHAAEGDYFVTPAYSVKIKGR